MRLTKSKNESGFCPALQHPPSINWMALILLGSLAAISVLVLPTSANAEVCQGPIVAQDLKQPDEIRAKNGGLNTTLVVRFRDHPCVPVFNKIKKVWTWETMNLRTFGHPIYPDTIIDPDNPNDPNLKWTFPGPTFRVKKTYLEDPNQKPGQGNPVRIVGDTITISIHNRLTPNLGPYDECQPAFIKACSNTGGACSQDSDCNQVDKTATCSIIEEPYPECFAGGEVTNLHYHGTHVSPQRPQDYVLLKLFPKGQTNPPPPPPAENIAVADYQTRINPLPWNQAEGTHWYHPHKHGSTALQVMNGMAGALIIEGPFDDWLYASYKVNRNNPEELKRFEKILVVQQVTPHLRFFKLDKDRSPQSTLVNGQVCPKIKMARGEVQRWRVIMATGQASQAMTIGLEGDKGVGKENVNYEIRQIAMDGVRFANKNYQRQPLTDPNGDVSLAPANRADFLVRIGPSVKPGLYAFIHKRTHKPEVELAMVVETAHDEALIATCGVDTTTPPLVLIEVTDEPSRNMGLPKFLPPMPSFLDDIDIKSVERYRTVAFSMTNPETGNPTTPGSQPNGFWIDKTQYMETCVAPNYKQMQLGLPEEWTLTNDSSPAHPFHIHINPFQVIKSANIKITNYGPPYVWQDTIALEPGAPVPWVKTQNAAQYGGASWDNFVKRKARLTVQKAKQIAGLDPTITYFFFMNETMVLGGKPKPGGNTFNPGDAVFFSGKPWYGSAPQADAYKKGTTLTVIRQDYLDYTGAYVFHCHILAHEDRGMMQNVQTVCPKTGNFGTPVLSGQPDNCSEAVDILPTCPPSPYAMAQ